MYIWLVWFLMNSSAVRNDEVGVDGLVVDVGFHNHVDVQMTCASGPRDQVVRFKNTTPC